jgi:DNA-3-methyladenine glycosylase II
MVLGPLTRERLVQAAECLADRDADLATILRRHGPPPMWGRKPGFPTLVRIILEQQVSLASARSTFNRLRGSVIPFSPERFVALGTPYFRSVGVTRQKSAYCVHMAREIAEGRLDLDAVGRMSDVDAKAALTQVTGIGPWTAEIYLLMALRRADVWPVGDLALLTSLGRLKRLRERPAPAKAAQIAERWRPFRSVAARMLWQHYLAGM